MKVFQGVLLLCQYSNKMVNFRIVKLIILEMCFNVLMCYEDNFIYGNKYTSPQLQRKISHDETSSYKRRTLPSDQPMVTNEHKKTESLSRKFSYPLNNFENMKTVCIMYLN